MAWRSDRLVIAVKRMAAALDTHFVFGAAFNCDRRLRTGLPVDSDLSLITGSSAVPTLTMLPPRGPLIAALALARLDQVKHPNFGGFSQGIQIGLASFFAALFAAFFSALLHAC